MSNAGKVEMQKWIKLNIVTNTKNIWAGFGGKSNPLNHITFYDIKTNMIISQKKVRDFSLLLNQKHQEHFIRVYCTDLTLLDKINSYFEYNDTSDSDN